ncbi:MAG TPA: 2-oxoglutarate dehydrogenase E1 component [Vicinamibacterales bacterium]|nr:2-oxoglutarate dehydrogenase E1 component [Vicinamibacterales bacterium]
MTWSDFQGVNRAYVLDLYEQFQQHPDSLDAETRELLSALGAPPQASGAVTTAVAPSGPALGTAIRAFNLAQSIRRYGHLAAKIDPLEARPVGDSALELATHGVTPEDLRALPADLAPGPAADGAQSLGEVIDRLRGIYCSTTGYDFAHIFAPDQRRWLREAVESGRFRPPARPIDDLAVLDRLTQVEAFEKFLHRSFPGKTRFSIEGLDTLVPILDEIVRGACDAGLRRAFIGMAHRGRLNVMAHVLGKPYEEILAEFADPVRNALAIEGVQFTGDVKYHLGVEHLVEGDGGDEHDIGLVVAMPPNPSHLEAIDPVIEGMARAAGTRAGERGAPAFDPDAVLPILIHGDAAFPGQGVVAETLNLHRLDGYTTGGTIHIIANNQIGFTTDTEDSYSTLYASGLARAFKIPIVHVNADDPEACIAAARLAIAYRQQFKHDVLIDLVGYRRYGHNEGDEPSFTQPVMYRRIHAHPTVRQIWAKTLESRGRLEAGAADAMMSSALDALQGVLDRLNPERDAADLPQMTVDHQRAAGVRTSVPVERLAEINGALLEAPESFQVHRKLERARERRRHAFDAPGERTIDWATAEELAFATILADGTPIRLTGEDVERGTFSHRHAVLYDANDGHRFVPLQGIAQSRAAFEIRNSPLSENAAIGFEYGYNIQQPERLVVWEAQYGDFINGAQVMLDEFVLSARAKWGQAPSLVLLLPHGYEGQGPDHASARPERFLQLAADLNMRVANCTTAAQYFHLLRRQAALLETHPLPLVVLTPKSLLRHPAVASTPADLAEGRWQEVLDDADNQPAPETVTRLICASGKIAVDLATSRLRPENGHAAICRLEQLYPFPEEEVQAVIRRYSALAGIVWAQEEPENMGAWETLRPAIERLAAGRPVSLVARPRSSSPAEGFATLHARVQEELIKKALTGRV